MTTLITLDEAPPLVQLEFAVYEAAGLLPKLTERIQAMAEARHDGNATLAEQGLLAVNAALAISEAALNAISMWADDGMYNGPVAQMACKHINGHATRALANLVAARELVCKSWVGGA